MVRVVLKGGVWTNAEDEVLKAAIQKYGKQQWARVASLLNRKTAKQAKARWYEWLDPAIRKTEWSRQEEEKLLQLAKLLPAQWKTIAPIVGRTATQCQEHYEYLLDQAASATQQEGDVDRQQTLRPGQIDSHPETKPARPDPIDMDEDELEMLQEARARLANTQGKKAKRKQREKMLQQAKRLADLQKQRELKQAGLMTKAIKKRKRGEIDLAVEIPFYKPAPAGFHDISTEVSRTLAVKEKRLKQVDFHHVNENRYRSRDYEETQRQKREEKRFKMLEQTTEKYAKQKEEEQPARPRGALLLPEPTVTDSELAQIAKLQQQHEGMLLQGEGGLTATQALLGDYSERPLPTPMRTPASTGVTQRDLIREASQLRALERGQTPLLVSGSQQYENEEGQDGQDEREAKIAAAATPQLPDRTGVGRTPGSILPRDELGLNRPSTELTNATTGDGDAASVGASTFASRYSIRELARQERRAAKRARLELEAALAALPAPQFEYELAVPADVELKEDSAVPVEANVKDQADIEAVERERYRKEANLRYEKRSSVLKRSDLPRPATVTRDMVLDDNNEAEAKRLIQQEYLSLLQHDAHAYPVILEESKKKKRKNEMVESSPEVVLEDFSEQALGAAREMIQDDLAQLIDRNVSSVLENKLADNHDDALDVLIQLNVQRSQQGAEGTVYTSRGWTTATDETVASSTQLEIDTLKEATELLRRKNDKLESKLLVVTGGYAKRSQKLVNDARQAVADLQNAIIEKGVYAMLHQKETLGGAERLDRLQAEVASLRSDEAVLQKQYGDLVIEKRRRSVLPKNNP